MVSNATMVSTRETGKHPCSTCHNAVRTNSIYCNGWKYWVHKKCSNLKDRLLDNKNYRCRKCTGEIGVHDGPQVEHKLLWLIEQL